MAVDISGYVNTQRPATNTVAAGAGLDPLASGQQNLNSSYQTFLTLLTAQLKNQDPTSPLDTNAFTQQLVQMTGVQQQLLSNKLLQQLVNQGGFTVQEAVGLIGKTVTADADTAVLKGGTASWTYSLPQAASQASLAIKDSTGKLVWSGTAPDLSSGKHTFTWDGKDSTGKALDPGAYTLSITASNANGAPIAASTGLTGVVTSVFASNGETMVSIGGATAPVSSISSVSGPESPPSTPPAGSST